MMNQATQAAIFEMIIDAGIKCTDQTFSHLAAHVLDQQTRTAEKGTDEDKIFVKVLSDIVSIISGLRK